MTFAIDGLGRTAVAASVLGALALGMPMASASPMRLAQTTLAAGAASPAAPGGDADARGPWGSVEGRITDLHTRLGITTAEEPRFTALAEAMRANAKVMDTVLEQRGQDTDMTAVSSLRWYARLTDARAAMLSKFVPAFETLYAALSDGQRKTADAIFQGFGQEPASVRSQ